MKSLTDVIIWVATGPIAIFDYSYSANPPPTGQQFVAVIHPQIVRHTGTDLPTILVLPINPERVDKNAITGDCYFLAVGASMCRGSKQEGSSEEQEAEESCK